MVQDEFINISFRKETLDKYYVRRAILGALQEHLPKFHGSLLDVGCGQMPYRDLILSEGQKINKYIGLDLENSTIHNTSIADLLWDGETIPLEDNTIETAMATEVLEHCYQPSIVLGQIYRVLKPGGILFFTVPFLWPLHEVPYDEYRYTPYSLQKFLSNAGFVNTTIKSLGGWDASLAQMIGLWVRRRPMSDRKRKFLSMLASRIIKYLISKDVRPEQFMESSMITGLQGIAYKA